ncbi:MAG: DNA mismatch repair protein MutS [Planctomycetota bacterium]|nr:DNA mismatch repair protein MutS [Planctomycetota bacterium]
MGMGTGGGEVGKRGAAESSSGGNGLGEGGVSGKEAQDGSPAETFAPRPEVVGSPGQTFAKLFAAPESSLTPMMRQYRAVKRRFPEGLLFFRLGDFYEMFFEDAIEGARAMGLTLTSREKGPDAVPMAGVPYHAVENYIARALDAGYKVVLCDQTEDPALARTIVDRRVTRIVTPGTLLEDSLLDPKRNNFLAAMAPGKAKEPTGLAFVDISTGDFFAAELPAEEASAELARFAPAECIVAEGTRRGSRPRRFSPGAAAGNPEAWVGGHERPGRQTMEGAAAAGSHGREGGPAFSVVPDWMFSPDTARARLLKQFEVADMSAFGLEGFPRAATAAGALISYLEETHRGSLAHIKPPKALARGKWIEMDENVIRGLEVFENQRTRKPAGSLLWAIDRTLTGMGGRTLRAWLARPLVEKEPIMRRQEAVAELVASPYLRRLLRDSLRGLCDIERIAARIGADRAGPRDLAALRIGLEKMPGPAAHLREAASPLLLDIASRLLAASDVAAMIASTLADSPPVSISDGGAIRQGVSEELDRLREVASSGRRWFAEFQAEQIKRTGIQSLKVRYNRVFGYYIEVTKANLGLVPPDYERRQTLAGAERFVTPELKRREEELLTAQDKSIALETEIFRKLRADLVARASAIQDVAAAAGTLDALLSLADVAADRNWKRPVITGGRELVIVEGRHPMLEAVMPKGTVVPNDLSLDAEAGPQILVLTGPNMAGKSTYIRQAALIVILAQIGSFVPAAEARVGIVDRLFARVGAADDLVGGRSTFMVEMCETARILSAATPRSFIILDEVGRGTSTVDGISLAWAIVEYLHETPAIQARTLFATHYHELVALADRLPRVVNRNVAVREWEGEITFLYRIVEGGADRSYGIHVAKLAGVPPVVIRRARQILDHLQGLEVEELPAFSPSGRSGRTPVRQPSLFSSVRPHPAARDEAAGRAGGEPPGSVGVGPAEQAGAPPAGEDGAGLSQSSSDKIGEILAILRNSDPSAMTPLQALALLDELVRKAKESRTNT